MANLLDYLKWRGDLRFSSAHPINDIDAMIFSRVSYLPFDKIPFHPNSSISSALKKMQPLPKSAFLWAEDRKLVDLLVDSERFKNLRLNFYRRENDKDTAKQFSAIAIQFSSRDFFLSFLGTDGTIYGWREDFNMSLGAEVPAQAEAKKYLNDFYRRHPLSYLHLGGHSKGGNLAVYSAVTAPDKIQRRIKKVYNFDGPGLSKELLKQDLGFSILPRIESFIPQDSVIGRLMEHREKFTVVKSVAENLMEHDIYSWEVLGTELIHSTASKRSDFTDRTITRWHESATKEEREVFVSVLFDVLENTGVGTPMDLALRWSASAPALVKSYMNIDKDRRKVMNAVLKKLVSSIRASRREEKAEK